MTEGIQLNIPQRLSLIRTVLTISLVVSVLMSFNLWAGERSFPYAPALESPFMNTWAGALLLGLSVLLLLGSIVFKAQRMFIFLGLAIYALLVLNDVNRLQPWFYVYSVMLFVFVCYNGRVDDSNRFTSFFILLQIILASVYFFSGLNQWRMANGVDAYLELIQPLKSVLSMRQYAFAQKTAVLAPFVLMFIGIGLVIKPTRYLAVSLALLVHVLLLVLLFPAGNRFNLSIWFCNISFAVLVMVLFSGKTKQRYFSPTYLFRMPLFYLIMALFTILPLFNSRGLWPDYLSANFNTVNNRRAGILISKVVYENLSDYHRYFCTPRGRMYIMDYNAWCNYELRVSCAPEKKVVKAVSDYLNALDKQAVKETELALSAP